MLDILYMILIAPIELGMRFTFEGAYGLVGSYGWAIIIMSLVVSIAIAPLYHMAENWQKLERSATQKFEVKKAEIKKAFKGQERHMMLRTLYRQNHYHPIMAVRTSFGFLIQVPFFFAAFHFLGNYEALNGQSFIFLNDLGKPDSLLNIFGLSINIMPFMMTLINLASAAVYGKNLKVKDNIQLYVIAAIFLILLYNAAAGLVLYWTANNVFSLIKNIIYARLNNASKTKSAKPVGQQVKTPGSLHAEINTGFSFKEKITWLMQSLGKIITHISLPNHGLMIIAILAALSFSLYLIYAHHFKENEFDILSSQLAFFYIKFCIALILYAVLVMFGRFALTFQLTSLELFRLAIFTLPVLGFIYYVYSYNFIGSTNAHRLVAAESASLALIALFLALIRMPATILEHWNSIYGDIDKLPYKTYLTAVLLCTSLIFLYTPISLLVSDPSILNNLTIGEFLASISGYFFVASLILGAIYFAFSKNCRGFLAFCAICLTISTIAYTYLFTDNIEAVDAFRIKNAQKLNNDLNIVYDVSILLLIFVGLSTFIKFKGTKDIFPLMLMAHMAFFIMSTVDLFRMKDISPRSVEKDKSDLTLPQYSQELLSFSKDRENVFILMLDMFSGSDVQPMLDKYSELKDALDGFVWYPNTLTAGSATVLGVPGIHGGHHYTPFEINKREVDSVKSEFIRGYEPFSYSFKKQGYDVVFAGTQAMITTCDDIKKLISTAPNLCVDMYDMDYDFLNNTLHDNPAMSQFYETHDDTNISLVLPALGVFKAVPYSLRRFVYGQRSWMGTFDPKANDVKTAIRRFSFIDALSTKSNVDSKNSTFKYIQSDSTHFPLALDANCLISDDLSTKIINHINHNACIIHSVVKWISWLKSNNIYDNTKIILVSDHGSDHVYGTKKEKSDDINLSNAHAVMLVKDFDATGALKIEDTFLSNADTPAIACSAIGGCEGIMQDPTKHDVKDRSLVITFGSRYLDRANNFIIHRQYEVKKSIFEASNWKRIK